MSQRRIAVPSGQWPVLGGCRLITEQGRSIALFNVDGQFYAIDDSCPHQGASLSSSRIEGHLIRCGAHGLRFDLANGYLLNSTLLRVACYPVDYLDEQTLMIIVPPESAT